jgi:hypothetical protein
VDSERASVVSSYHSIDHSEKIFNPRGVYDDRVKTVYQRWVHNSEKPAYVYTPENYWNAGEDSTLYSEPVVSAYEDIWSSLVECALLPLTTEFNPKFNKYGVTALNSLSVSPHTTASRSVLINELIAQRLNANYQLIKGEIFDEKFGKKNAISMCVSRKLHQIVPTPDDDFNLEIESFSDQERRDNHT